MSTATGRKGVPGLDEGLRVDTQHRMGYSQPDTLSRREHCGLNAYRLVMLFPGCDPQVRKCCCLIKREGNEFRGAWSTSWQEKGK